MSNYEIKIRNYHIDNHGHVNNARYMEFIEEGSWKYLEDNTGVSALFDRLKQQGIFHAVVNANINYRSQVVEGDVVRVTTKLANCTNRSFSWHKEIINTSDMTPVIDGLITCVFWSTKDKCTVKIDHKILSSWPELKALRTETSSV